ncbi:GIY-YIG nuclease family protein [Aequorivita sp. CIP111184]|uniref:GIY-YIG nuclease family protein n=1 Tax=Aequorivita sp. CIP111184 TaxID=2211356 RepID=UPI000DCFC441|nr:GIY-YIG nuclease family protein [Aequorivita sp. CIP111184]
MHYLYIIHSLTLDSYYVGESPDIHKRLKQHNEHYFKSNFTKAATDWKISLEYECANRSEALFLEKFIKKMKSRVFIEKVIDNPKILLDILKRK